MTESRTKRPRSTWVWLAIIGLAAGYLSGLFGVGGGVLVVPALVLLLKMDQRLAVGTSLAAIVPVAIVGVISYSASGSVDWVVAALLAAGSIVGAQFGTVLLHKVPRPVLQWGFIGFMALVMVSLFVVIPSREAVIALTIGSAIGVVVLGFVTGVLSGLLGIGGGVIVVPMLIIVFGAGDLVARGTSIAMQIPTAISGTVGNFRRRNIDIPAALTIGIAASTTTALGAITAASLDPFIANLLFAIFIAVIAVRLAIEAIRSARKPRPLA